MQISKDLNRRLVIKLKNRDGLFAIGDLIRPRRQLMPDVVILYILQDLFQRLLLDQCRELQALDDLQLHL